MIKRRIKRQPRAVKLLLDREIQLLLRDQDADVSATKGRWNRGIKQSLVERSANKSKKFRRSIPGAVAALNPAGHARFHVWPRDGTKNQPTPHSLFEIRFGALDRGIFFQRGVENAIERDRRRDR